MSTTQAGIILGQLHKLMGERRPATDSDRQLLERFAAYHDEAAFAALVERHGPTVLGVCRRLLHNEADAEDAFQATFLILARKAGSVRKQDSLGSFLYGVAVRVARKARVAAARRRSHEARAASRPLPAPMDEMTWRELRGVLDEELARLPEKYRAPLVLCCLEGRTRDEAAERLGWTVRAVKARLERARELLRGRLKRRGLALSGVLFASLLSGGAASVLPPALAAAAAGAGLAGAPSPAVAALVQGVVRETFLARLKLTLALVLALGVAGGAGVLAHQPRAVHPPAAERRQDANGPKGRRKDSVRTDRHGDPLPAGAAARLGTVRFRQGFMVLTLAFSPDGKTIVAGGAGRTLGLWDAATGREIRQFPGRSQPASVAFSPDGKLLACPLDGGPPNGGARVWEAATGKEVLTIKSAQKAVAFSPDGKLLATAGYDNRLYLWDVRSGEKVRTFTGHESNVISLVYSPDGKTLASSSLDKTTRLWDAASGKELHRLPGHAQLAVPVAFSPDGRHLASGGDQRTARLWDARTGKALRALIGGQGDTIRSVAFSPGGKLLACAYADGTVHLCDRATGKEIRRWQAASSAVSAIAFAPDGKTLASGGFWGSGIRLWDVATGEERAPRGGHHGIVDALRYSPDGRALLSASRDQTVRRWDPAAGRELHRLRWESRGFTRVALSPDGKTLASGDWADGSVRLWDATTGKQLLLLRKEGDWVYTLTFSPDGRTLAAGGNDRSIRLWDVESGKELRRLAGHDAPVTALAFSPDGKRLASGADSLGRPGVHALRLWDVASGKELRRFEGGSNTQTLAFSPDGKFLASGDGYPGDTVRLWDAATGKQLHAFVGHKDSVGAVAFSPTGRYLASALGGTGKDSTIRLWEVATRQEVRPFQGHHSGVGSLAFSPDGRYLASGGCDSTILIWDLADQGGRVVRELADCWKDLAALDAPRAYRSLWRLASDPRRSLPLLRRHLRPAAPPDPARRQHIARLIANLDHDDFEVRQRAADALVKLGDAAEPALRRALQGKPTLEVRRRVEAALAKIGAWSGPRLQSWRALEAVEEMPTTEARQFLEDLAGGEPDAWLTGEAKAALDRLNRRPAFGSR